MTSVSAERGAVLLGLGAIAIAQPIFEVVSNSPEFFPARGTPGAIAAAAVIAICFGLPLLLLGIERGLRAFSVRAGSMFHGAVIGVLVAALVMPWFHRGAILTFPWDVVVSALLGVAAAAAYGRLDVFRHFLMALAPAAAIVPILFFLNPGVKQNFLPSASAAAVQGIDRTPPIVFIIFDELPVNSLLAADGTLDAERFPNFGELAKSAYWFRNTSTVAYTTSYAVPTILSGRYLTESDAVPTLRYYPVNLFTALARHYDIFTSMRFQQLCPPGVCHQSAAIPDDTVHALVSDFGLVWLHIVLPETLTDKLPPIAGDWAEFGGARAAPAGRADTGRGAVFAQFVASIDRRPARLHFIHTLLPHMPFEYVASGRQYRAPDYQDTRHGGSGLFEAASPAYADTLHQRHLAQVGFADRLLGHLIARMRAAGAYDEALVIVTADHGASYREGRLRRQPRLQQHNLSDILQVPLFIKLPGQPRGEVVDRLVETVDILPTILDVVGAKYQFELDGRSLFDAQARPRRSFLLWNRQRLDRAPRRIGDLGSDRAASLERKDRRFGRGDLRALYAPPDARYLLGTDGGRLRSGANASIALYDAGQFDAVDRSRDPLPIYVRGVLTTPRRPPLNIAVVVNGTVAAVAESYEDRGAHTFGTLIPETVLRDGKNTVTAFVVDEPRR